MDVLSHKGHFTRKGFQKETIKYYRTSTHNYDGNRTIIHQCGNGARRQSVGLTQWMWKWMTDHHSEFTQNTLSQNNE